MQARAVQPIRWDAIGHLHCGGDRAIEAGRAEYPQVEALPVRVWLPNFNGTQREELLAMDADAPFVRGLPVEEAEDGWPPLG
ncbi:MAG TPA: hypothetical protein DCM32_04190 [Xanthomonadaceae bacterium]|nr:hypothetical protein [Xanthomonadaceae bacterium]